MVSNQVYVITYPNYIPTPRFQINKYVYSLRISRSFPQPTCNVSTLLIYQMYQIVYSALFSICDHFLVYPSFHIKHGVSIPPTCFLGTSFSMIIFLYI